MRKIVLRVHGGFIALFGLFGIVMDLVGYYFGVGAWKAFLFQDFRAVGFFECHFFAIVMGLLFIKYSSSAEVKFWNIPGAVVGLALGTANLIWWDLFPAVNNLPMGYISTGMHWLMFAAHAVLIVRRKIV